MLRSLPSSIRSLSARTGLPLGDLTVLKSWESSEKEILNQIACRTRITDDYRFAFIPVGYNLGFEDRFLRGRPQAHGLPAIDVLSRPCIDLQDPAILMNRGEFKGASLDKITAKSQSGGSVPDWYRNGKYEMIDAYVRDEATAFIEFFAWLLKTMPDLRKQWDIWNTTKAARRLQDS